MQRLFLLVEVALLVVLGLAVARIAVTVRQPQRLGHGPASGSEILDAGEAIRPEQAARSAVDLTRLARLNLFANPGTQAGSAQAGPTRQELTHLLLTGTIMGSPTVARAILKDTQTQTTVIRKMGEHVAGGTIEGIARDHVVIAWAGQREVLKLAGPKDTPNTQAASPSAQIAAPDAAMGAQWIPVEPRPTSARESMIEDLFKKASIMPYAINGQVQGLRITGLDPIPFAKVAGLAEGDVIRMVNGQTMTSTQKAFQVFKKIRGQETLDIELLRGGKNKTLSFNLK